VDSADIKKLILHPNARNIYVGEVIQLYAKAVLSDGSTCYLSPSSITWQVDNEGVGTISAQGVFRGISAGSAEVTISYGGLTCSGKVFVKQKETTFTLSGVVYDSDGKPVSGAVVMVLGLDTIGISGADGSYSLPGLSGTDLNVLAYYGGVLMYSGIASLSGNTTFNITLSPQAFPVGSISGKVTDTNGNPLQGVLVSAGDWSTASDEDGVYTISRFPQGSYHFSFTKFGFSPVSIYAQITGGKITVLDVVLEPIEHSLTGTLNGRVIDKSGVGILNAAVQFSSRDNIANKGVALTDSNGFFSFANVPAGSYQVDFEKDAYQTATVNTTVAAGNDIYLRVILALSSASNPTAGTVTGKVTSGVTGIPVFGAVISIGDLSTTTDIEGNYTIEGVKEGTEIIISAVKPHYSDYSGAIQVIGGQIKQHNIEMHSLFIKISNGAQHTLALKSDGTVWAWGNNVNGKLGDGTQIHRYYPVQVLASGANPSNPLYLNNINDIATGGYHNLALKSDGTVWAWGWNSNGQLGNGTTDESHTPI
jgi:hypothetical protein